MRQRQLAGVIMASALITFDGTATTVALPVIGRDLSASISRLQWIANAPLLVLAAMLLPAGTLADRFGRVRVMRIGLIAFVAASCAAAAAPSDAWVISAKFLQGAAGALVLPAALAVLREAYTDADERARMFGIWAAWTGVASALGPLMAGRDRGPLVVAAGICVISGGRPGRGSAAGARVRHQHDKLHASSCPSDRRVECRGWSGGICAHARFCHGCNGRPSGGARDARDCGNRGARARSAPADTISTRTANGAQLLASECNNLFSLLRHVRILVHRRLVRSTAAAVLCIVGRRGSAPDFHSAAVRRTAGRLTAVIGTRWVIVVGALAAALGIGWIGSSPHPVPFWSHLIAGTSLFGFGLSLAVSALTHAAVAGVPEACAGTASGLNHAVVRAAGLVSVALLGSLAAPGMSNSVSVEGVQRALVTVRGHRRRRRRPRWCVRARQRARWPPRSRLTQSGTFPAAV